MTARFQPEVAAAPQRKRSFGKLLDLFQWALHFGRNTAGSTTNRDEQQRD